VTLSVSNFLFGLQAPPTAYSPMLKCSKRLITDTHTMAVKSTALEAFYQGNKWEINAICYSIYQTQRKARPKFQVLGAGVFGHYG